MQEGRRLSADCMGNQHACHNRASEDTGTARADGCCYDGRVCAMCGPFLPYSAHNPPVSTPLRWSISAFVCVDSARMLFVHFAAAGKNAMAAETLGGTTIRMKNLYVLNIHPCPPLRMFACLSYVHVVCRSRRCRTLVCEHIAHADNLPTSRAAGRSLALTFSYGRQNHRCVQLRAPVPLPRVRAPTKRAPRGACRERRQSHPLLTPHPRSRCRSPSARYHSSGPPHQRQGKTPR